MVEFYDSALQMRNYKKATRKRIIQIIRRFTQTTNDPANNITPTAIENYLITLQQDGKSSKTIENHQSALKGFFDFLTLHGIINNNPVINIKRLNTPETLPVYLPDLEIELLLELATQEKILVEVITALNTGLRLDELRHLQWKDIDLNNKQIVVQGQYTKSKRPRTIPLNTKTIEALTTQKQLYGNFQHVFPGGKGGPNGRNHWTENTMRSYKWWLRLSLDKIRNDIPTIANLPKGTTGRGWHTMRHTFATKLAKAGVDMFKIKDWMGHKKIETTMRYVHITRQYDSDIELI